jgi:hypothetical protein
MKFRAGEVLRYRATEREDTRAPIGSEIRLTVLEVDPDGDAKIEVRKCKAEPDAQHPRHHACVAWFMAQGGLDLADPHRRACEEALRPLPSGILSASRPLGEEFELKHPLFTFRGRVARLERRGARTVAVVSYGAVAHVSAERATLRGQAHFDIDAGSWISGRVEYEHTKEGARKAGTEEFYRVEDGDPRKAICDVGKVCRPCKEGFECVDGRCQEIPDYCSMFFPCRETCDDNPLKCTCRANRCGPDCNDPYDCPAGKTWICKDHRCVPDIIPCSDTKPCGNPRQTCENRKCIWRFCPEMPCLDGKKCVNDKCVP